MKGGGEEQDTGNDVEDGVDFLLVVRLFRWYFLSLFDEKVLP